jgi:hypothetical protein
VASVNPTDDLIWEVQDQVSRVERKVNWLVSQAGGDPEVVGRPDRLTAAEGFRAA